MFAQPAHRIVNGRCYPVGRVLARVVRVRLIPAFWDSRDLVVSSGVGSDDDDADGMAAAEVDGEDGTGRGAGVGGVRGRE
jgi:hypothetical protein